MHVHDYRPPPAYAAGRFAREKGLPKAPPFSLTWCDRHWWYAGFNDADMELSQ